MTPDEYLEYRRAKWNAAHEVHHPGALSGSDPAETWRQHNVVALIRPGAVILDIGVGLGNMARALAEKGCVVDCLDVADAAHDAVRPYARSFYLAKHLDQLPNNEYDLALSQLVAQHMPEQHLRPQLVHVYRAIKPSGLFSLHLAGSDIAEENNLTGEIPDGFDGRMCRTPEYAVTLVGELLPPSHQATILPNIMRFSEFQSYWYWLHIRKG